MDDDAFGLADVDLDRRQTVLGELVLRRGTIQALDDTPVYEILLDGELLMSSVVNTSESALARVGLEAWGTSPCRVLVGGLGLGYTAHVAAQFPWVASVDVVELLAPVLEWHATSRLPLGTQLSDNPRVRLVQGDFFAWVRDSRDCAALANRYDVILLDIDHASDFLLQPSHSSLYTLEGLRQLAGRLDDDGVFAFWSSEPDEGELAERLQRVFPVVEGHAIEFYDPGAGDYDVNSVLVARKRAVRFGAEPGEAPPSSRDAHPAPPAALADEPTNASSTPASPARTVVTFRAQRDE